jgi:hypothetical protein
MDGWIRTQAARQKLILLFTKLITLEASKHLPILENFYIYTKYFKQDPNGTINICENHSREIAR